MAAPFNRACNLARLMDSRIHLANGHDSPAARVLEVETTGKDTEPLLYWRGGYGSLLGDA